MRSIFIVGVRLIGFYGLYESLNYVIQLAVMYFPDRLDFSILTGIGLSNIIWIVLSLLLLIFAHKIADLLRIKSETDLKIPVTERGLLKAGLVTVGVFALWYQLLTIPQFIMTIGPGKYMDYAGPDYLPIILRFLWLSIPIWIILKVDWIVKVVYRKSDVGGE